MNIFRIHLFSTVKIIVEIKSRISERDRMQTTIDDNDLLKEIVKPPRWINIVSWPCARTSKELRHYSNAHQVDKNINKIIIHTVH